MSEKLTHFDKDGNSHMVDVSSKNQTMRKAIASGRVYVNEKTLSIIKDCKMKKGNVLQVAQIAGIMGAKRTSYLIPLCHPIFIENVELELKINEEEKAIDIQSIVKCTEKTGVEMEALTAVSVAALTIYDMCKSVQKDIVISDIKLLEKTGGKSGKYIRKEK